jgi:hypothetical protein
VPSKRTALAGNVGMEGEAAAEAVIGPAGGVIDGAIEGVERGLSSQTSMTYFL